MLSIVQHHPLRHLNTFGMTVYAPYFSELEREEDLNELDPVTAGNKEILLLGGGSNILFTSDPDYWVIHNKIKGIKLVGQDEDHVWIEAGAGEVWHDFVQHCVQQGYGGIENLSLIPGTVGAAPIQNIGAYGAEIKDVLDRVRFWNISAKTFKELDNRSCGFGYRDSVFKRQLKGKVIITSVRFRLYKKPVFNTSYGTVQQELDVMGINQPTLQSVSEAIIRIRRSKLPDPLILGNAGSFFKNPEVSNAFFHALKASHPDMPGYVIGGGKTKLPAAWLIEQCGWKGYRKNDYGVHAQQALVLVNYAQANGMDIARLSDAITTSVYEKFGIALEKEVWII